MIYTLFPPSFPATNPTTTSIELIDKVLTEGMLHAEKKCWKIFAGEVPFSGKLATAGRIIKVWKLVLRHKQTNNVNTRLIRRVAKTCGLKQVLSVSLYNATRHLARAESSYKKMKKTAHRLRHEFLCNREDLAQGQKAKKEILNIRRHEETRRMWRAINRSQGKAYDQGISKVDINVDGEWKTVTDRKEIEPTIMTNNSKRFNLTLPTQMMSKRAVKKIGYLAEKKYAFDILEDKHVYDP